MYYGERFNAYSHLIGTVLSVIGTVFLLIKATATHDTYKIVSVSIYGASLILLYSGSTFYHSVRSHKAKMRLQKLDHCVIYILIAGSYTPYTLVSLNGAWGWSLFGVSWGLALFGIIQELTLGRRTRFLSLILYPVMGWIVIVAIVPLLERVGLGALAWLLAGGILYSVGIYWFINDEKIKHGHGIWHLFVLGGSLCQFISVYFWVT